MDNKHIQEVKAPDAKASVAKHETVIDIRGLNKWYKNDGIEFQALYDIDLKVEKGEFVAILGPSGSGKSTLMNIIGCLDSYDTGSYHLSGKDVKTLQDKELAKFRGKVIGFVFQSFNLLERYSVLENIMLPSLYVPMPDAEKKAMELLELLDIADKAKNLPSQISGGQKQRVAIARALMMDPDLLLADEPTGNLDTHTGKVVLDIFNKLHAMGKTIVLITHDQYIAQQAKRQVKILDGHIVA